MALAEAYAAGMPIWGTQVGWLQDLNTLRGIKFSHKQSLAQSINEWDQWTLESSQRTSHFLDWHLQAQTLIELICHISP